ncbi:MAG: hypothetical protein AB8I08_25455 [Sandaracinaceae bacterium]
MPNVSETALHTLRILSHTHDWVDPHAAGLPVHALAELSRAGFADVLVRDAHGEARLSARATETGRRTCRSSAASHAATG